MATDNDLCAFSDLPKGTCGDKCCRPDLTIARRQPTATEVLQRITARFPGKCAACSGGIREGDLIGRTNAGDYVCEGCCS